MGRLDQYRAQLRTEISQLVGGVEKAIADDPRLAIDGPLYKRDSDGAIRYTKTGTPGLSTKTLQMVLLRIKDIADPDGTITIPRQAKGAGISTSSKHWAPHRFKHLFLDGWLTLGEKTKLLGLLPEQVGRVRPRYRVLVKTGRTSCSSPNIQQVPRDGGVRELFIPSPGHVLLGADYRCIEMVALAQVCLDRFGSSRIAELLREGRDLHVYTASRLLGISPDKFEEMKSADLGQFSLWRQRAKAVNFGVPGGMGAETLRACAQTTYGVVLSAAEAVTWRNTLITGVFPELRLYLDEDSLGTLAENLGCSPDEIRQRLLWPHGDGGAWLGGYLRRVIAGHTHKRGGEPYKEWRLRRTWEALAELNRNPGLHMHPLGAGPRLETAAFSPTARIPTGRLRGGCNFTAARNTPFQGLAADGAKLALFELARLGWRIVAFIHDEIIVEVPKSADVAAKSEDLRRIMREQMQRVVPNVPVVVGPVTPAERWSK